MNRARPILKEPAFWGQKPQSQISKKKKKNNDNAIELTKQAACGVHFQLLWARQLGHMLFEHSLLARPCGTNQEIQRLT